MSEGLLGLSHFHKMDQSFGWDISWLGAVCCISDQLFLPTYVNDLRVAFLLSFQVICKDKVQNNWPTMYLKEAKTCVSNTLLDFYEGLAAVLLFEISF